jgi:nanoRNase/pAp phosphatase (c-di-AMP/oligoRNAs hydrolase)
MEKVETIKKLITDGSVEWVIELINNKEYMTTEEAKQVFLFLYDYTNSFKNANTTPDILKLAWKTLEFWIQHDKLIVDKLKKSYSQMKMCSEVISALKLYDNCVWWVVTKQLLDKHWWVNICIQESFMSNILVTISKTNFWFLLVEREVGEYEIKLASKYEINEIPRVMKELWINKDQMVIKTDDIDEVIEIITR